MFNSTIKHPSPDLPLTTIIIVNYNCYEDLVRCLESIINNTHNNYEIIVVDNASTNGTTHFIQSKFENVKVIFSKKNLGFGGGCNLGALHSNGTFLLFLNPDTIVTHGWFEALIQVLQSDSSIGLVTSKILLSHHPEKINTCGNNVHITGITQCRGLGYPKDLLNKIEDVLAISGAAFAIRRSLFEALEGFDEDMFLYMEDTDISVRAKLAGWRCVYVPESVVFHDYSFKLTNLKIFYQERNRYLMLCKNFKWLTLIFLLPSLILAELITWAFVFWKDRSNFKSKYDTYRWVFINWRRVLHKRNQTQNLRKTSDRKLLEKATFKLNFDQIYSGILILITQFFVNSFFFIMKYFLLCFIWW